MTTTYSRQQVLGNYALAVATAGASLRWTRIHGCTLTDDTNDTRAEGIALTGSTIWRVTQQDLDTAIDKIATSSPDKALSTLTADRLLAEAATQLRRALTREVPVPITPLLADVILQVAIYGRVMHP